MNENNFNLTPSAGEGYNPAGDLAVGVIFFAIYIAFSYMLYKLAKKMGSENAWLAWVPFLNIFLMADLAKISYWWILVMFVPLANAIFVIWLWWKISELNNRPGWWGILMAITPINLILLYFLAFKSNFSHNEVTASNDLSPL